MSTNGATAKGATLRTTLDFVREEKGVPVLARVMERLAAEDRALVERTSPTDELPYALVERVWAAADAEVGPSDPTWMERAGARSIQRTGVQLYGGILKKHTPTEFLTQGISLFQLYYHPGNMEVVEQGEGRAVLRLVAFEPPGKTPLFCRRQTGGLAEALRVAGGEQAKATHVRCTSEGDAFCEWELVWK